MQISYDKHSLKINNERVLIKSAAIHYFRTPGVEAWRDRLNKLKACGYNAVDLYFCWGFHSKEPGVYNFTGIRDIRALLDLTVELGLFVIARPGPYINAEVSLGGLPKWILNVPDIILRNRKGGDFVYSENYMRVLKEWYSRIIPIINEYHNVVAFQIENEYYTNEAEPDYLQELYDLARSMGIRAPIFHNDALGYGLYSDIVNIYAFDTYPTINMNYDWKDFPDSFGVLDNAEENLGSACEDAPLFVAELQGGWFDKWDGPGYEKIRKYFQKEHINIVTKTALSQGITMFNHYMGCGGTSWGDLACTEVYTSYDFSAPVSESGIPMENYYKSKEINTFLNSFNLASTDLIAQGSQVTGTDEENILARIRKDNINSCKWLFIRNLNKDSKESKEFIIESRYKCQIKPYDMKILPVELGLKACNIDFSGMPIFGKAEKEEKEIVFIIIEPENEIVLSNFESFETNIKTDKNDSKIVIKSKDLQDFSSIKLSNNNKTTEIIFINEDTADKTWILSDKILIGPEYLTDNFKKAAFSKDSELKILDLNKPEEWKTKNIKFHAECKEIDIADWKIFNCAPEIDPGYDCSGWNFLEEGHFDCINNKIYDDYIWYKGNFKGHVNNIELSAKHCYALYLNGNQIYSHDSFCFEDGCELSETVNFEVNKKYLNEKGPNEITVLVQNMGFDKGFANELAMGRGILKFKTFPEKEIEWQIRGGLTPIIEEWDFIPFKDLADASENNYFKWMSLKFQFKGNENIYSPLFVQIEDAPFSKADIFLNGNKIGHYWKSKGSQNSFYIPEAFLNADNTLSLAVWDRENSLQVFEGYHSVQKYVNIKIRNIKSYTLIALEN